MSLKGGSVVLLNKNGEQKRIIKAKGKHFRIGSYLSCDYVLDNSEANAVHCQISCDGFGKVTVKNYSKKNPILLNGVVVRNCRRLYSGSKITIFGEELLWTYCKKVPIKEKINAKSIKDAGKTPSQKISHPDRAPNSEPSLKTSNKKLLTRTTNHIFYRNNFLDSDSNDENDENDEKNDNDIQNELKREATSNAVSALGATPPRADRLSIKNRKSNTLGPQRSDSTKKVDEQCVSNLNQIENSSQFALSKCQKSDSVITSYSTVSNENCETPKSFSVIISRTPASNYATPREYDLIDLVDSSNLEGSSMYLIDLTTPENYKTPKTNLSKSLFKSALKNSTKLNKSNFKRNITFSDENQFNSLKNNLDTPKKSLPRSITPLKFSNLRTNNKSITPNQSKNLANKSLTLSLSAKKNITPRINEFQKDIPKRNLNKRIAEMNSQTPQMVRNEKVNISLKSKAFNSEKNEMKEVKDTSKIFNKSISTRIALPTNAGKQKKHIVSTPIISLKRLSYVPRPTEKASERKKINKTLDMSSKSVLTPKSLVRMVEYPKKHSCINTTIPSCSNLRSKKILKTPSTITKVIQNKNLNDNSDLKVDGKNESFTIQPICRSATFVKEPEERKSETNNTFTMAEVDETTFIESNVSDDISSQNINKEIKKRIVSPKFNLKSKTCNDKIHSKKIEIKHNVNESTPINDKKLVGLRDLFKTPKSLKDIDYTSVKKLFKTPVLEPSNEIDKISSKTNKSHSFSIKDLKVGKDDLEISQNQTFDIIDDDAEEKLVTLSQNETKYDLKSSLQKENSNFTGVADLFMSPNKNRDSLSVSAEHESQMNLHELTKANENLSKISRNQTLEFIDVDPKTENLIFKRLKNTSEYTFEDETSGFNDVQETFMSPRHSKGTPRKKGVTLRNESHSITELTEKIKSQPLEFVDVSHVNTCNVTTGETKVMEGLSLNTNTSDFDTYKKLPNNNIDDLTENKHIFKTSMSARVMLSESPKYPVNKSVSIECIEIEESCSDLEVDQNPPENEGFESYTNFDSNFDKLIGKPIIKKTYSRKTISPQKNHSNSYNRHKNELPSTDIQDWVDNSKSFCEGEIYSLNNTIDIIHKHEPLATSSSFKPKHNLGLSSRTSFSLMPRSQELNYSRNPDTLNASELSEEYTEKIGEVNTPETGQESLNASQKGQNGLSKNKRTAMSRSSFKNLSISQQNTSKINVNNPTSIADSLAETIQSHEKEQQNEAGQVNLNMSDQLNRGSSSQRTTMTKKSLENTSLNLLDTSNTNFSDNNSIEEEHNNLLDSEEYLEEIVEVNTPETGQENLNASQKGQNRLSENKRTTMSRSSFKNLSISQQNTSKVNVNNQTSIADSLSERIQSQEKEEQNEARQENLNMSDQLNRGSSSQRTTMTKKSLENTSLNLLDTSNTNFSDNNSIEEEHNNLLDSEEYLEEIVEVNTPETGQENLNASQKGQNRLSENKRTTMSRRSFKNLSISQQNTSKVNVNNQTSIADSLSETIQSHEKEQQNEAGQENLNMSDQLNRRSSSQRTTMPKKSLENTSLNLLDTSNTNYSDNNSIEDEHNNLLDSEGYLEKIEEAGQENLNASQKGQNRLSKNKRTTMSRSSFKNLSISQQNTSKVNINNQTSIADSLSESIQSQEKEEQNEARQENLNISDQLNRRSSSQKTTMPKKSLENTSLNLLDTSNTNYSDNNSIEDEHNNLLDSEGYLEKIEEAGQENLNASQKGQNRLSKNKRTTMSRSSFKNLSISQQNTSKVNVNNQTSIADSLSETIQSHEKEQQNEAGQENLNMSDQLNRRSSSQRTTMPKKSLENTSLNLLDTSNTNYSDNNFIEDEHNNLLDSEGYLEKIEEVNTPEAGQENLNASQKGQNRLSKIKRTTMSRSSFKNLSISQQNTSKVNVNNQTSIADSLSETIQSHEKEEQNEAGQENLNMSDQLNRRSSSQRTRMPKKSLENTSLNLQDTSNTNFSDSNSVVDEPIELLESEEYSENIGEVNTPQAAKENLNAPQKDQNRLSKNKRTTLSRSSFKKRSPSQTNSMARNSLRNTSSNLLDTFIRKFNDYSFVEDDAIELFDLTKYSKINTSENDRCTQMENLSDVDGNQKGSKRSLKLGPHARARENLNISDQLNRRSSSQKTTMPKKSLENTSLNLLDTSNTNFSDNNSIEDEHNNLLDSEGYLEKIVEVNTPETGQENLNTSQKSQNRLSKNKRTTMSRSSFKNLSISQQNTSKVNINNQTSIADSLSESIQSQEKEEQNEARQENLNISDQLNRRSSSQKTTMPKKSLENTSLNLLDTSNTNFSDNNSIEDEHNNLLDSEGYLEKIVEVNTPETGQENLSTSQKGQNRLSKNRRTTMSRSSFKNLSISQQNTSKVNVNNQTSIADSLSERIQSQEKEEQIEARQENLNMSDQLNIRSSSQRTTMPKKSLEITSLNLLDTSNTNFSDSNSVVDEHIELLESEEYSEKIGEVNTPQAAKENLNASQKDENRLSKNKRTTLSRSSLKNLSISQQNTSKVNVNNQTSIAHSLSEPIQSDVYLQEKETQNDSDAEEENLNMWKQLKKRSPSQKNSVARNSLRNTSSNLLDTFNRKLSDSNFVEDDAIELFDLKKYSKNNISENDSFTQMENLSDVDGNQKRSKKSLTLVPHTRARETSIESTLEVEQKKGRKNNTVEKIFTNNKTKSSLKKITRKGENLKNKKDNAPEVLKEDSDIIATKLRRGRQRKKIDSPVPRLISDNHENNAEITPKKVKNTFSKQKKNVHFVSDLNEEIKKKENNTLSVEKEKFIEDSEDSKPENVETKRNNRKLRGKNKIIDEMNNEYKEGENSTKFQGSDVQSNSTEGLPLTTKRRRLRADNVKDVTPSQTDPKITNSTDKTSNKDIITSSAETDDVNHSPKEPKINARKLRAAARNVRLRSDSTLIETETLTLKSTDLKKSEVENVENSIKNEAKSIDNKKNKRNLRGKVIEIEEIENKGREKKNTSIIQKNDIQLNSAEMLPKPTRRLRLRTDSLNSKSNSLMPNQRTPEITNSPEKGSNKYINTLLIDTDEVENFLEEPKTTKANKLRAASRNLQLYSKSMQTETVMASSKSTHAKNTKKSLVKDENLQEEEAENALNELKNLNATKPHRGRPKKQIDSTNLLTNSITFEQQDLEKLKENNFPLKCSEILPRTARNMSNKNKNEIFLADSNEEIINKEKNSFSAEKEKFIEGSTDSKPKNAETKRNNRKLRGKNKIIDEMNNEYKEGENSTKFQGADVQSNSTEGLPLTTKRRRLKADNVKDVTPRQTSSTKTNSTDKTSNKDIIPSSAETDDVNHSPKEPKINARKLRAAARNVRLRSDSTLIETETLTLKSTDLKKSEVENVENSIKNVSKTVKNKRKLREKNEIMDEAVNEEIKQFEENDIQISSTETSKTRRTRRGKAKIEDNEQTIIQKPKRTRRAVLS